MDMITARTLGQHLGYEYGSEVSDADSGIEPVIGDTHIK
jgi:hypothetical protein